MREMQTETALPAGFREDIGNGSGLIVPEAVSRQREVITQDEWAKVRRAINDVCAPHNLKFVWLCNDAKCAKDPIMKRIRTANGFVLRCQHRDIVYSPDI